MKLSISLSAIVPSGVYSSVRPMGTSIAKIEKLMNVVKFIEPNSDDPHVTIIYSYNKNKVTQQPIETRRIHIATISSFISWIGHNDKPYIVALLNSGDLQRANEEWMELGYTTDFPEYKPHITIKKDIDEAQIDEVLALLNKEIAFKPITLVFGEQRIEPLDD